jgi:hypothetical protein
VDITNTKALADLAAGKFSADNPPDNASAEATAKAMLRIANTLFPSINTNLIISLSRDILSEKKKLRRGPIEFASDRTCVTWSSSSSDASLLVQRNAN